MDTNHSHNLTQKERVELQARIQRLEWLLKECIGIEEYELCSQIRNIIQRHHQKLNESNPKNQNKVSGIEGDIGTFKKD